MVFQPGQSGNPSGYNGGRQWRHRAIFDEIKQLGHRDALITLSTIQHETQDESLKIAAAAALAPYAHPKLQSIPTPRFIEHPIDVPDFTSVEIAESFLAKVTVLTARGELDFQSALELSTMAKAWIETQYAKQGLDLKAMAQGADSHDTTIRIEGGLPQLPGTNVTMPVLNGTTSYEMLEHLSSGEGPSPSSSQQVPKNAAPAPEPNDSPPTEGSL
jgi:hypothetical protein